MTSAPEPSRAANAAQVRLQILRDLGLDQIRPEFDTLADELKEESGVPYAIVNIFDPVTGKQLFIGLAAPPLRKPDCRSNGPCRPTGATARKLLSVGTH
ncbi:hypothetical protein SMD44_p10133 (plasmid) [Streptomyces alboflavus]|uniref:GAF domain-containing protein n=1 Tax=Streptomyces alboflavus TaxID=67267 RepID=A0A291W511_9ACTN|nr:hypothetical protein SMD44_p10133 [Streptomyces alboflavus]